MKRTQQGDDSLRQETQYANLVRYKPSKAYFARIRINGKLIRWKLKTKVKSIAELRSADLRLGFASTGQDPKQHAHNLGLPSLFNLRLAGSTPENPGRF